MFLSLSHSVYKKLRFYCWFIYMGSIWPWPHIQHKFLSYNYTKPLFMYHQIWPNSIIRYSLCPIYVYVFISPCTHIAAVLLLISLYGIYTTLASYTTLIFVQYLPRTPFIIPSKMTKFHNTWQFVANTYLCIYLTLYTYSCGFTAD